MVPADLVTRWEAAYRHYCNVSESAASPHATVRTTARAMAISSRDVAIAWRQITLQSGLPWWTLAALTTAAQAFEHQSHDWLTHSTQPERDLTTPLTW